MMEMHFGWNTPETPYTPAYLMHHCDKSHMHHESLCQLGKGCLDKVGVIGLHDQFKPNQDWVGFFSLFMDLPTGASLT